MSRNTQKYSAPLLILIIILIVWESLVNIFQIEQFLLPKPTAIVSNLVSGDRDRPRRGCLARKRD